MRGSSSITRVARCRRPVRTPATQFISRRAIQISAVPTAESPMIDGDAINTPIDSSLDPAGRLVKLSCNWNTNVP
jgi:hypothetical protein